MIRYIILFFIFGIVGWAIDTAYRTIINKKYSPGTWIPYFSIIFTTGGFCLYFLFTYLEMYFVYEILIGWIVINLVEFFGGILSLTILKRRLWDYSKNKYNLLGHIDALHSFYWLIAAIIFYVILELTQIS